MRFASLGSGSSGNALVVEVGRSRVLLDCGFTTRETAARLARLGLSPEDLSGIVVTHEHADHISGVARLAAEFRLPVWLTHGTLREFPPSAVKRGLLPQINLIDVHGRFHIGEIEIQPFPVPHDAREPVQFLFGDGARRLGVLTDAGSATAHVEAVLSGCHALVLECNHDREMLKNGGYPPPVKRRIAGRFGHLDNEAAAQLLARLDNSRLQHLVAAHISRKNNTPFHARIALSGVLNCTPEWIGVACQQNGFGWREIS